MPMSGGEGRNRCYCYYKLCILVVVACTVLFAAITADRSLEGGTWPKWDEVRNIYVLYFPGEGGVNCSGDSYSTFGQREDGSTSVVQHLGKNAPSADSSAIWNWVITSITFVDCRLIIWRCRVISLSFRCMIILLILTELRYLEFLNKSINSFPL
jgi:hypothetical protein